ncbi:hypothetical protein [Actinoplanes nipponensis]|uniref:hypothetical protein n=1 Tax=Actinoplanes nipponensis TaxID=135950 RepID=UPI001942DA34|nr:hypothetical protein [Actinoplanes nipponensis]
MAALLAASGLVAGCGAAVSGDGCAPPRQGSASAGRPTRFAINHDAFQARHIGHTADGRQFFLTTPFDTGTEEGGGRLFVALYLFDAAGRFLDARIDDFGDDAGRAAERERAYDKKLKGLGKVTFDRIEVEPFGVERFGMTFGLIVSEPESDDDIWWVTAEPGDYMAFSAPWDCGEYDT